MIILNGNLSKHFTQAEYHKGATAVYMYAQTMTFVKVLTKFRAWLNQPMTVVSWYRTVAENKSVGGISNSNHLTGTALDFRISGKTFTKTDFVKYAKKWAELCKYFGCVGECGFYPTGNWIHLGMQNPSQAVSTGHKFVHWKTVNGKQTMNPYKELIGL